MSAVSPHEDEQKGKKDREGDTAEEQFRTVFGESAEEVVERVRRGEVGEEAVRARARKTGAVPSEKEVESATWTTRRSAVCARAV